MPNGLLDLLQSVTLIILAIAFIAHCFLGH